MPVMPETVTIPIGGMTCQHCAASVVKALSTRPGVTGVAVDLGRGSVEVTGATLDIPALRSAIEDLGFDAGEASRKT